LELQQGGNGVNPDELTLVSDSGCESGQRSGSFKYEGYKKRRIKRRFLFVLARRPDALQLS